MEAVNKWKEEVLTEQTPPSDSDSPVSIHMGQAESPELFAPPMKSSQAMHPAPSSLTPKSLQTMATTKSPVDLSKLIQGDGDNDDGKDENVQVVEWGSLPLTLSTSALADIWEIPELPAMDDSEIQEIGSDSEQGGCSQQAAPEHDVSTLKKERPEKSFGRLYKPLWETCKEVYNADHRFIIHIWDKREQDCSINLSTVATCSPIFKVLDHIMWEEEKFNCHSLFCVPSGPWDRPSELKKSCTTIQQKGYAYFQLVAFSWKLGLHAVLAGIHMEEALQWSKISEEVPSSLKWLKELVFCL